MKRSNNITFIACKFTPALFSNTILKTLHSLIHYSENRRNIIYKCVTSNQVVYFYHIRSHGIACKQPNLKLCSISYISSLFLFQVEKCEIVFNFFSQPGIFLHSTRKFCKISFASTSATKLVHDGIYM